MADYKFKPNTHPNPKSRLSFLMVFVEAVTESGCWIWMGGLRNGYGIFNCDGKKYTAHRFSYEAIRGPIPEGLTLDHLCRVTCCVNPWHLEPVTQHENTLRGEAGKYLSDRTHCPKGHPYSGDNLRIKKSGARRCNACSLEETRRRRAAEGRDVGGGTGGWEKKKTHCPYGHEYTTENTYIYNGSRRCRACWKRWKQERRERELLHRGADLPLK